MGRLTLSRIWLAAARLNSTKSVEIRKNRSEIESGDWIEPGVESTRRGGDEARHHKRFKGFGDGLRRRLAGLSAKGRQRVHSRRLE
ncbi:hypothetical protein GCM10010836_33530 [Aminobacter aminovorans]